MGYWFSRKVSGRDTWLGFSHAPLRVRLAMWRRSVSISERFLVCRDRGDSVIGVLSQWLSLEGYYGRMCLSALDERGAWMCEVACYRELEIVFTRAIPISCLYGKELYGQMVGMQYREILPHCKLVLFSIHLLSCDRSAIHTDCAWCEARYPD